MDKDTLEETLTELRKDGKINEIRDFDEGEKKYSLTDEGKDDAEALLKTKPDAQLMFFSLMWNDHYSHMENGHEKLLRIADDMRENPGVNILRTLVNHGDKVEGIEISDDVTEDFLRKFDP